MPRWWTKFCGGDQTEDNHSTLWKNAQISALPPTQSTQDIDIQNGERFEADQAVLGHSSAPQSIWSLSKRKMSFFIVLNIGRDCIPLIKYLRSSTHGQSTSMLPIMFKWSATLPLWLKGCQTFSCPKGASVLPSSYLGIFRHLPLIKKVSYVSCVIKQISYIQIFRPNRFQA